MEKCHNRLKDLWRDRGGELDELEQSVNESASFAHSGDDDKGPEGDELAEVEKPGRSSGRHLASTIRSWP